MLCWHLQQVFDIDNNYRIVLDKHPWALAAQAPKLRMAVARRKVLDWVNYPAQVPTPDAKLAARGYQIGLHRHFVRDSSRPAQQWKKGASCYKADWLVASLPSFWAFSPHLHYANFMLQGKNAVNEATDRFVQTFDAGCRRVWSASEWSQLHMWAQRTYFRFITQKFCPIGGYMEYLKKPTKLSKFGVGAWAGIWALDRDNAVHSRW